MSVEPESLIQTSAAVHKPDIVDMLNIADSQSSRNLSGNVDKAKRRIKFFALLTPSLAQAVQVSNMTAEDVLLKVVKRIKAIIPAGKAPTNNGNKEAMEEAPQNDDTILKNTETPYEQVLLFLWTCHHLPAEMKHPNMAALQNGEAIDWDLATHIENPGNCRSFEGRKTSYPRWRTHSVIKTIGQYSGATDSNVEEPGGEI